MTSTQLLALLLAISAAINTAFVAALLAGVSGESVPAAALVGGGAALTVLTAFFAGVAAYGGQAPRCGTRAP